MFRIFVFLQTEKIDEIYNLKYVKVHSLVIYTTHFIVINFIRKYSSTGRTKWIQ